MYNNEFSIIDTPDKAYVIGLIYSDGCITYKKAQCYRVSIKLNDVELLEKIQTKFPFFCKPKSDKQCYTIYKDSKKFVEDMILIGALPSKSFANKDLLKLPNISMDLLGHFLRGLFDGDGCAQEDKSFNKRIDIYGVTEMFFLQLKCHLETLNIKSTLNNRVRFKRSCYTLRFCSEDNMKRLIDYIKPNEPNQLKLARKWLFIESWTWKNIFNIKSETAKRVMKARRDSKNRTCLKCSSLNNRIVGAYTNGDRRIHCLDCGSKYRVHFKLGELTGNS